MADSEDSAARFRALLGDGGVENCAGVRTFSVDGRVPRYALFPATVEEVGGCAAVADQAGLAVIPVGNGTHLGVGRPPHSYDVALSTRRLKHILAHEAADMTVTVEAGLTLAALNAAMAAAGQRLPLDPPHPEHTTLGALIATDASGPLRLSQGKVRDLLIGIKVVLANGTLIKGGGRVVKNVAGYDLMKLFTGSFGSLGIIVEASFKVRPCPEREAVIVMPAASTGDAAAMALAVLAAPLAPSYVEVLNRAAAAAVGADHDRPVVVVGLGGCAEEIDAQRERLEAQFGMQTVRVCDAVESARLYAAVRDFPAIDPSAEAEENPCGCKVSLLPSKLAPMLQRIEEESAHRGLEAAVLSHLGSGVAFVRFDGSADAGAFPLLAEWLCTTVREAGGWAVFDLLPTALKDRIDPWGADIPGAALMRGIKQTLDPNGRLSPGRFVAGI